jgi:hypothetical protein
MYNPTSVRRAGPRVTVFNIAERLNPAEFLPAAAPVTTHPGPTSSDSKHGQLAPRSRAPKFKPGPVETAAIVFQLCTDIPYTYSRNEQKRVWIKHLNELKQKGLCIEIPTSRSSGFRTLVKWCNGICKKRVAFCLKERKQSGLAKIEPPTAIDTVVDTWNQYKVAKDLKSRQSAAQACIIRSSEAATSNNESLIAMVARAGCIQAARDAAHQASPLAPFDSIQAQGQNVAQLPQIPSATIPKQVSYRSMDAHQEQQQLASASSGVDNLSTGDISQIVARIVNIRNMSMQPPEPRQSLHTAGRARGVRERLRELIELLEDEEISEEEYARARMDILIS